MLSSLYLNLSDLHLKKSLLWEWTRQWGRVLVKNGEYMSTRVETLSSSMQVMLANHPKEPLVDRKNAFWIHSRQCSLVDWVLVGVVLVAYEQSSCIPVMGAWWLGNMCKTRSFPCILGDLKNTGLRQWFLITPPEDSFVIVRKKLCLRLRISTVL